MEFEPGLLILVNTIRGKLRHRDYVRVTDLAKKYKALATGEDAKFLLKKFTPREDDVMFEQREELTQLTTPDTINSLTKPMYKVGRTIANVKLSWDKSENTEDEKRRADIQDAANKYFGNTSLTDYLATRLPQLDSTDPNAFIVTELPGVIKQGDATAKKLTPYPYEVNSTEAINYNFKNNILEWLIVLTDAAFGEKYTMYLDNETIVATEIDPSLTIADEAAYIEQLKAAGWENVVKLISFETEQQQAGAPVSAMPNPYEQEQAQKKKDKSKRRFIIQKMEHKGGRVPAFRVGCTLDLYTDARTCVPLIHPAMPYLLKAVKAISEFDLTNCLHVFPQKVQYAKACQGVGTLTCNNGRTAAGATCSHCKGTGEDPIHKTAQDVVTIRMPKDPKDMIDLDKILVYKHPPIDLLTFQEKLALTTLREKAQAAVYNSDIFAQARIQQTATESNIDYDSVQDTLKPFADKYSDAYKHTMILIATYRDHGQGFSVVHKLPKDLKMKTLGQLVNELKSLNDSGAPSYLKQEVTMDIARQVYVDRPEEIKKLETKNKYMPFPGKSDTQIQYIINNNLTTRYNKVLWSEFDTIFQAIENEFAKRNLDFYALAQNIQELSIKAKVQEVIDAQDEDAASLTAIAFNDPANTDPTTEPNLDPNAPAPTDKVVQDTALNGSQVSSMIEMCLQVTQEGLPLDTVRGIMSAAFPLIPQAVIDNIMKPMENFVAAKENAKPAPPQFN